MTENETERPRITFDLPLKGDRSYLHSTNIFRAFVSHFSPTGALKLDFRKMIHDPIYLADDAPEEPHRVGRFSFQNDDGWKSFGIFADNTRQIETRISDNENELLLASWIEGDRAGAPVHERENFIDTAVALNKVLVSRSAMGKKPVLTNIALDVIPDNGRIDVTLVKKLGSKIFISDVSWDDVRIGNLTFMTG